MDNRRRAIIFAGLIPVAVAALRTTHTKDFYMGLVVGVLVGLTILAFRKGVFKTGR